MTREEREEMAKPDIGVRDRESGGPSLPAIALGVVAGAAALFFLDPQMGRRRRAMVADRVGAVTRRGSRRMEKLSRYATNTISGVRGRVTGDGADAYVDDRTLTDRVDSEVFRDQDLPKGELNIDTVGGVVMIRGQVDRTEIMNEIIARTWRVEGVKDVMNLMHLPGTPAPHMD